MFYNLTHEYSPFSFGVKKQEPPPHRQLVFLSPSAAGCTVSVKKRYRNVLRNWQVPISNKIHDLKIETVYSYYKFNRNTDTKKSGRHDGRGNANLNRVSTHRWSWQSLLTSKDRSTLSLIWRNLPSGGWSIWSLGVYNRFLTHYFSLFYFLLLALPYYEANKPTYWP